MVKEAVMPPSLLSAAAVLSSTRRAVWALTFMLARLKIKALIIIKRYFFFLIFYIEFILLQLSQQIIQSHLVGYQYLTRLRTLCFADDACCLKLVHKTSGAVVTDGELALNLTC